MKSLTALRTKPFNRSRSGVFAGAVSVPGVDGGCATAEVSAAPFLIRFRLGFEGTSGVGESPAVIRLIPSAAVQAHFVNVGETFHIHDT